jgi:hypothetical protein
MTERGHGGLQDQVERKIRDIRKLAGCPLLWSHAWTSINSPAGFPDLVIIGPYGIIFAELKREGENPTPEQLKWLTMLRALGYRAYVWRPSDLYSGLITREITALTTLPVHVPRADVTQLAGILLTAVGGSITPGLAENLARAAIRAGYTRNPQPPITRGSTP